MNINTQTLTIYLTQSSKQKVGILATKNNKIYFEYDKEFLKTGIELSPFKLPLKAGLFKCDDETFDGLWGLFADSLPDGWGRLLLDRHFVAKGINPKSLSPLDRLAYVGSNGMGALSYEPETNIEDSLSNINIDEIFTHSQEILQGSSKNLIDELLVLNGSSCGARPKILVQINDDKKQIIYNNKNLQDGFSHWIIKFASTIDDNQIGAIEYAYSLMAKKAGINMTNTYLFEGDKSRYFATKRFDRLGNTKIHMHSLAGIVHSDFRYPTLDYDDILSVTMHLTKNMQEVKKVFRLAVFNLFAHNRDDHAKNFSFIMDEKNQWHLSPIYDITFSYGVGTEHSTMYMGEGKNPTIEHLLKLSKKYNIKEASTIIEEVKNAISLWAVVAKEVGINAKMINQIQKELKKI
jgi:serine/threonine-protein kinase HipA